ncbi:MAG: 16S rRNA (adenine(1518)-N(6)/adenine(1519)-N(6))-dimethyltransferase RsmA [Terriglobia bacterium]
MMGPARTPAPRLRRRLRRPRLGQHFLAGENVRREILRQLDARPEDYWLEIGAGHGEMTVGLAATGGAVRAVERDPELAQGLRVRLAEFPHARVIESDILKVSLDELAQQMGCARYRVYGNVPYYITSPILRHLFRASGVIADMHLVVQREVAERLVATPGGRDYGYLSVLTQFHATAEILQSVPRGAFRPQPQVDSALVQLVPPGRQTELGIKEPEKFLRFLQTCFQQKRKTLVNNLRGSVERAQVEQVLTEAGLDRRARAEKLSLEDFSRLFRRLGQRRAPSRNK